MPETGQTVFHASEVGFQKMPARHVHLPGAEAPLPPGEDGYAFLFTDGQKTIVVPITDFTRKSLVDVMRKAPLQVPEAVENGAQS